LHFTYVFIEGSGEGVTLSRRKSFQKMVRQSFRRLRGRSSDVYQLPVELNQDKEIGSKSSVQPDMYDPNNAQDHIHSFIDSGYFYRSSSSPLLLLGAPDYSIDTVSELTRRSATGKCK